jgi:hypothetical protein
MYQRAYQAHPEVVTDLLVSTASGAMAMQTSRDRRMAIAGTMSVTELGIEDILGNGCVTSNYDHPDTMADVIGIKAPNGQRAMKLTFTIMVERAHMDIIDHNTILEVVGDLTNMVEL